jgi:hypothetical protein
MLASGPGTVVTVSNQEGGVVLRRYAWQIGGVVTAAAVVAVLVTLRLRGSGTTTHAGATPVASASATPTADSRAEQVKAVARAFVEAVERSRASADPKPVHQFTETGTQADGNGGIPATTTRLSHRAFVAQHVYFDEGSWQISVAMATATVTIRYSAVGHDAVWPSLQPLNSDHTIDLTTLHLELDFTGGKWLISAIR